MKVEWEKQRERIIHLYNEEEMTLREIGKLYGVSHVTINSRLSEWGIIRRGGPNKRKTGRRKNAPRKYEGGLRLGHLILIGKHPILYPIRWICQCACGKIVVIEERYLKTKASCGCKKERKDASVKRRKRSVVRI